MKTGRGAYKACALARSADRERLARLLMRETGALGVRHAPVGRTVEVELPYGRCRVKVGSLDGEDFVVAPAYADAKAAFGGRDGSRALGGQQGSERNPPITGDHG